MSLSDNPVAQRLMKIIGIGHLVCIVLLIALVKVWFLKEAEIFLHRLD